MTDMSDVFRSEWMKHADLKGKDHTFTISAVGVHEWDDGKQQLYVEFVETDQRLGLNKTNASMIAEGLGYGGEDLEKAWVGRQITVGPDKTTMSGKVVDCIRVRAKVDTKKAKPPKVEISEESIPF